MVAPYELKLYVRLQGANTISNIRDIVSKFCKEHTCTMYSTDGWFHFTTGPELACVISAINLPWAPTTLGNMKSNMLELATIIKSVTNDGLVLLSEDEAIQV